MYRRNFGWEGPATSTAIKAMRVISFLEFFVGVQLRALKLTPLHPVNKISNETISLKLIRTIFSSVDACGFKDLRGDNVRIHIRSWPPVFEVAATVCLRRAWNSHRRTAVGNPIGELVDWCCLVRASKASLVSCAVNFDVLEMFGFKLLDS